MNIQAIAIAIVVAFLVGAGSGWKYENGRFMDFKKEVAVVAAKQEAKVESIQKQHELVTKGIENEYSAKLSNLRNYYKSTSVWNNTSGGTVPGISAAPQLSDVIASYNVLAGQCAETTLQVTEWQRWYNGIKEVN
jgi:hypothetical protein